MESNLSTDASGVPPREEHNDTQVENEESLCQRNREMNTYSRTPLCSYQQLENETWRQRLTFSGSLIQNQTVLELPPDPPDEWALNNLLQDIASCIGKEELSRIKILFRGPRGIGKRDIDKCDTCIELFNLLRERLFISRGNIVYLNRILDILDRPELTEKAAKYGQDEDNVIYYYTAIEEPEPGTKLVKFHVVADIRNCSLDTIERLQHKVAKIVCAPVEYVRIVGIQPGSSLIVTLMLPENSVTVLKSLLDKQESLWELTSISVNIIVIDDHFYHLSETSENERGETEQQKAFLNVYEQLAEKHREMEIIEQLALNRQHELQKEVTKSKSLEEENQVLQTLILALQKMHLTSSHGRTAFEELSACIREATANGQDMELVHRIIKANSHLVSAYTRNANNAHREAERARWNVRRAKEKQLLYELMTGLKSPTEVLHTKFNQHTLDKLQNINGTVADVWHMISGNFSASEQNQLLQRYSWAPGDDLVKSCIEKDQHLLLLGLYIKECEREDKLVNSGDFVRKILADIKRQDLIKLLEAKLSSQQKQPKTVVQIDADELERCLNIGAVMFKHLVETFVSKLISTDGHNTSSASNSAEIQRGVIGTRYTYPGFTHPHPKATQFHFLKDFFRDIGDRLKNFRVFV